jgi:trimeric autotransporter adhesin
MMCNNDTRSWRFGLKVTSRCAKRLKLLIASAMEEQEEQEDGKAQETAEEKRLRRRRRRQSRTEATAAAPDESPVAAALDPAAASQDDAVAADLRPQRPAKLAPVASSEKLPKRHHRHRSEKEPEATAQVSQDLLRQLEATANPKVSALKAALAPVREPGLRRADEADVAANGAQQQASTAAAAAASLAQQSLPTALQELTVPDLTAAVPVQRSSPVPTASAVAAEATALRSLLTPAEQHPLASPPTHTATAAPDAAAGSSSTAAPAASSSPVRDLLTDSTAAETDAPNDSNTAAAAPVGVTARLRALRARAQPATLPSAPMLDPLTPSLKPVLQQLDAALQLEQQLGEGSSVTSASDTDGEYGSTPRERAGSHVGLLASTKAADSRAQQQQQDQRSFQRSFHQAALSSDDEGGASLSDSDPDVGSSVSPTAAAVAGRARARSRALLPLARNLAAAARRGLPARPRFASDDSDARSGDQRRADSSDDDDDEQPMVHRVPVRSWMPQVRPRLARARDALRDWLETAAAASSSRELSLTAHCCCCWRGADVSLAQLPCSSRWTAGCWSAPGSALSAVESALLACVPLQALEGRGVLSKLAVGLRPAPLKGTWREESSQRSSSNSSVHDGSDTAAVADAQAVISVHIGAAQRLGEDARALRPCVRVHAVSASTGRYLAADSATAAAAAAGKHNAKQRHDGSDSDDGEHNSELNNAADSSSKRARRAAAAAASAAAARAAAATTQQCCLGPHSDAAQWNAPLLLPALPYTLLRDPDTLLLFEVLEHSSNRSTSSTSSSSSRAQPTLLAWGFLRPAGDAAAPLVTTACTANTNVTANQQQPAVLTLQLYWPALLTPLHHWQARHRGLTTSSSSNSNSISASAVYVQWLCYTRHKYPSTLTVRLERGQRPPSTVRRQLQRDSIGQHDAAGTAADDDAAAAATAEQAEEADASDAPVATSDRAAAQQTAAAAAAVAAAAAAARQQRLRAPPEPCIVPRRILQCLDPGPRGATSVRFSNRGDVLAVACCEDPCAPGVWPLRLFDTDAAAATAANNSYASSKSNNSSGALWCELRGHRGAIYDLHWSSDDSLLLSASADGTAAVWRVTSDTDVTATAAAAASAVEAAEVASRRGSADSTASTFAVGTSSSSNTSSGKRSTRRGDAPKLLMTLQHSPPTFVYCAVFQPGGAFGSTTSITTSTNTAATSAEVTRRRSSRGGSFSANSSASSSSSTALAVTGGYDRRLRLWDLSRGGTQGVDLGPLGGGRVTHEAHVNALVYDPRNGRLYSGDAAGVVLVWRRAVVSGSSSATKPEDYGVLRRLAHSDLAGATITSLALAPQRRRAQLLVQAQVQSLFFRYCCYVLHNFMVTCV